MRRHWRSVVDPVVAVPMVGGVLIVVAFLALDDLSRFFLAMSQASPSASELMDLIFALAIFALVAAVFQARRFRKLSESRAKLEELYDEAAEEAMHDGSTSLGNHRSFHEELARQVALFHRNDVGFVLLLVDIDNLKAVNDAGGHAAGDAMILSLASTMREVFRASDRLFRIGGDEFAVIMPGATVESALVAAKRLQHFSLLPRAGSRPASISSGISSVPQFAANRDQVYRQADAALYWAKRHGRATVEVFDSERDRTDDDVAGEGVANAVYDVVRGRSLSAVFQPFVDLRSGDVLGFEGLVRPDPSSPLSDASSLFAAASATGWTVELDLAAIGVIARSATALGAQDLLSVNLSSRTLELKHFDPAWLLDPLKRHTISPQRVVVELTERDAIGDMKQLQRNVSILKKNGFRIAADDVGAGNSGLRLLSQLQFDFVKIDLSLVHESVLRSGSLSILRSLRDIASSQGAVVIAEGVETSEHLWLVQELEIPVGQGYLLGRPDAALRQARRDLPKRQADDIVALPVGPATAAEVHAEPLFGQ